MMAVEHDPRPETEQPPPVFEAWREVMHILEPLDPEARARVLCAVAILFGVELSQS